MQRIPGTDCRAALAVALLFATAAGSSTGAPAAPAVRAPDTEVAAVVQSLGLIEAPHPVRDDPRWHAPHRIVVRRFRPDTAAWLQPAAPGVELVVVDTDAQALAAVADADALVGFCDSAMIAAGTHLEWVQSFAAGVDRCIGAPAIAERGVLVTNMQRLSGPAMSEHVIALLFALARDLPQFLALESAHRWDPAHGDDGTMHTLQGRTLLVYGLGGIGTEVAKRAHALGMRVTAIRATSREGPDFVSQVGLPADLPKLAAEADVVVNCAPLTAATRGLFDAKVFAAMKPTAYFVNVGRGASVVTSDLVAALDTGRLAGAGLDVTDPEPLPPDHPLWRARNVIITPHVSGAGDQASDSRFVVARENLRRFVAGERMLSVVDPGRGY